MDKKIYPRLETFLFIAVGILTFALLLYLWLVPNTETVQTRDTSGYFQVTSVDYSERTDEDGGLVRQFRFRLDEEISYDTSLIFRFHHQSAAVYLDGELVYSLTPSPQLRIVRTPGGQWAMIPLYREDVGKEVLVELRPVYGDYENQAISFFIGSKLSIYTEQLVKDLPEILLCLADVFVGLLMFCIGVYLAFRKENPGSLYALAGLSISLGIWNFSQNHFALLVLPEKNTFVYYVSITSLAISVIALIKSVRKPKKPASQTMLRRWMVLYCVFLIWQLVFQLLGILDLRQTLKCVHAALIVTAVVLIVSNVADLHNARKVTGEKPRVDVIWILGVGVLLDLLNYYAGGSGSRLIFVLLGVFIYVLMGGYQMFTSYIKQRRALEEKENQLTMSRITTMMSQIRSHFVFNVLNAISGMCKYDPEKADETVVRFSRYLRSNIDIMEDDKNVPFQQEMERLEDYVVLEQIRFGDRIEFTTDIQAVRFTIPPLILQPIVENAIKHGISKRQEGGKIALSTRDAGENIVITITDNGIGFPMEALDKQTSVGLRNIRFRLYHLVGGTMDIKSQLGLGTTVTLTIPKERAHESDLH